MAPVTTTPKQAADGAAALSPAARRAWQDSALEGLSAAAAGRLLVGARETTLPAGETLYGQRYSREDPVLALMITGLLRVFTSGPDGRQATIRYVASGDLIGVPATLVGERGIDAEVLEPCHVLRLSAQRFRKLVRTDPEISFSVLTALIHQFRVSERMLEADVFLSVRARVAAHLLDLGTREEAGIVVGASHQEIADAAGTVREVVSRTLRRLQDEGLVEPHGNRSILIADAAGLHRIAGGER